jgi:hypothetical protein
MTHVNTERRAYTIVRARWWDEERWRPKAPVVRSRMKDRAERGVQMCGEILRIGGRGRGSRVRSVSGMIERKARIVWGEEKDWRALARCAGRGGQDLRVDVSVFES